MFFAASDDDDGGSFTSGIGSFKTGSSSLSSLFGTEKSTVGNESLKYSAPKQPKTKAEETPSDSNEQKPDSPSLLFACAVHAFRLLNGEYVKQGKVGAAVLGSFSSKDYKILLYITQKKPVANATIHAGFVFNLQKGNYATFYDDQSQNWSICFETDLQLLEFAKWVGLAHYNASGNKLITQDLNFVDDQEIKKGDSVEIAYTGWLHAGNSFGKVFDSNKDSAKFLTFKVGKGKVIKGWDQGVIGMKKLSKRLLVIPPDLGYGQKAVGDNIPQNSTLIFQIEVTRVKFVNTQAEVGSLDSSMNVSEKKSEPVNITVSVVHGNNEEDSPSETDSLRDRAKSINDHISKLKEENSGSKKSKLLERMSKMGHSMMPTVINNHKNTAEAKEEVKDVAMEINSSPSENIPAAKPDFPKPDIPKPVLRPKPEPTNQAASYDSIDKPVYQAPNAEYIRAPNSDYIQPQYQPQPQYIQQQISHPQQLTLYQSSQAAQAAMFGVPQFQTVPPTISSLSSTEMNLIMTDGRLKHSEIKNDLIRIMDKLDSISQKIFSSDNGGKYMQTYQPVAQAPEMEANVLMQNITRIIKENEKLHSDCDEKNKKIELLNERMSDLLTKNQQFLERSNTLIANQSDSLYSTSAQANAKVVALEEQNAKLEAELSTIKKQFFQLKSKQDFGEQQEAEMNAELQSLKRQLKVFKESQDKAASSSGEQEVLIDELNKKLIAEKREQKQLQSKFVQLEEEHAETLQEKNNIGKTLVDLKKKIKEEQRRWEEELEILKTQHEEEIQTLKLNFRKSSNIDKLATLEKELKLRYENEMAEKIDALNQKHNNDLAKLHVEKEDALANLKEQQAKEMLESQHSFEAIITKHRLHAEQLEVKNADLLYQMQEKKASITQEKSGLELERDSLNTKIAEMEKLCERLTNVVKEKNGVIDKTQSELIESYERGVAAGRSALKTISASSYERGFSEGKASIQNPDFNNTALIEQVKKIMNSVYFQIKGNFVPDQMYSGEIVVGVVLEKIKTVTLQMTKDATNSNKEVDSSEEEEEEEEEAEEEAEEEEEEGEVEGEVLQGDKNQISYVNSSSVLKDELSRESTLTDQSENINVLRSPSNLANNVTNCLTNLLSDGLSSVNKDILCEDKVVETPQTLSSNTVLKKEEQSNDSPLQASFVNNAQDACSNVTKKNESQKSSIRSKPLFDDDDDDKDFMTISKNSKPTGHSRSPPPLFEDDDGDTNWI